MCYVFIIQSGPQEQNAILLAEIDALKKQNAGVLNENCRSNENEVEKRKYTMSFYRNIVDFIILN